jgi:tetratricopeptide (TPR) repeat protein
VEGLVTKDVDELAADWQKWRFLFGEPGHFPLGLGWAYLLAERTQEAEAMFISGTGFDFAKNDPVAHSGLGFTYLNMARHEEAEAAFRAGLESGRDKGAMLRGIGTAQLLQGDAVGAEQQARRALAEDHPHIDSWRLLGFALAEQGRHAEALQAAERSVAMDSSRTSYELLAWVLVSGNLDVERGIEMARRAMELPSSFLDVEKSLPHRACAHHSLGLAYLKQGKLDLAAQQLAKAAELQPNRACIHDDMIRLHDTSGGT